MAKRITLKWEEYETTLSFIEPFYSEDEIIDGEWSAPYPNTVEDSQVFGLIEGWSQGERFITSMLYEMGEPNAVIIETVTG